MSRNLYFDNSYLPSPTGEYVLWCDGMGTGRELTRSLARAASFIFRVHIAFDSALKGLEGVKCYPVMDGVYVTTPNQQTMRKLLRDAFCLLGRELIGARGTKHMFMVRAGLAYGATIHGADVAQEAFIPPDQLEESAVQVENSDSQLNSIRSRVLLSSAMVDAFTSERAAPPFGVYVHPSAQAIPQLVDADDKGFIGNLYQWWSTDDESRNVASELVGQVDFYLEKALCHSVNQGYSREAIGRHQRLVTEYFGGLRTQVDEAS